MDNSSKKYLKDIIDCIDLIDQYTGSSKIWNIIINHLPLLKQEASTLLYKD